MRAQLLSLSVLGLSLKLGDFLLNALLYTSLELRAVSDLEEELEPDEHRSEEDSLNEVVKESGGALLEGAVADELGNPGDDVDAKGDLEGAGRILETRVTSECGASETKSGENKAGDGL